MWRLHNFYPYWKFCHNNEYNLDVSLPSTMYLNLQVNLFHLYSWLVLVMSLQDSKRWSSNATMVMSSRMVTHRRSHILMHWPHVPDPRQSPFISVPTATLRVRGIDVARADPWYGALPRARLQRRTRPPASLTGATHTRNRKYLTF